MNSLVDDFAAKVFDSPKPPCLSLYQPTHRSYPDRQQDRIRFENLLRALEETLRQNYSKRDADPLLEPFRNFVEDSHFWNHGLDGMAMLGAEDFFRSYQFPRLVPECVVVADSFHIKPLLRIVQSADRYQVLGISATSVRMFEGNRDQLGEVDLPSGVPRTVEDALGRELTEPHRTVASYGTGAHGPAMEHGHGARKDEVDKDTERFFRAVDRAFVENDSQSPSVPLILAALPEYHNVFRRISRNPRLFDKAIDVNPDDLKPDDFRKRAWEAFEPQYQERIGKLIETYHEGKAKGFGEDDPFKIAEAAATGRVGTVLIKADHLTFGQRDRENLQAPTGKINAPDTDEILDDIAEIVMRHGGEAIVVPDDRVPSATGAAAIYRYQES